MHQGQAVASSYRVAPRIVPDDQAVILDLLGDLLPKGVRDQSVHSSSSPHSSASALFRLGCLGVTFGVSGRGERGEVGRLEQR